MNDSYPVISVITATYNRSNVLRHTIESVQRQECPYSWEHIIVGDGCTDDTEAVVREFNDPRLSFFNLENSVGEQSGPNNEGFKRARGRYIAYLNHDDLWFPDHLSLAMKALIESDRDGVFCQGFILSPDQAVRLCGVSQDGSYHLNMSVPASLWVMKRETIESLNGWRPARDMVIVPSQDFLIRALKAGLHIRMVDVATAILIQSGSRKNCYVRRDEQEQADALQSMKTNPFFREYLLHKGLVRYEMLDRSIPIWPLFLRMSYNILKRMGQFLGITPVYMFSLLTFCRKGSRIRRLRRMRGLSENVLDEK